jgi:murein DD-endopeptidase MepM/ murein hydrolase activator NlpD
MSNLTPLELVVWILLIVPYLWSGLASSLLYWFNRRVKPVDRTEKIILALFLAPFVIGGIFLCLTFMAPNTYSMLPIVSESIFYSTSVITSSFQNSTQQVYFLPFSVLEFFLLIWITVTIFRLYKVRKMLFFLRGIRKLGSDQIIDIHPVKVTQEVISPFSTITNEIVLPKILVERLSQDELYMITQHELAHIVRKDPVYFLMLSIVEALNWFNPIIGKQVSRCRLAAELACDSVVISQPGVQKKAYAKTITQALKHTSKLLQPVAPSFFSKKNFSEYQIRITQIMAPSGVDRKLRMKLVSLSLLSVFVCLTQVITAQKYALSTPYFTVTPLLGRLVTDFGIRNHPISGKSVHHRGVDIAAPDMTLIRSPANGSIIAMKKSAHGYGNVLVIDHGRGYTARYAQLDSFNVSLGEQVKAGDIIARVGSSGAGNKPHLHLEVSKNGKIIDPTSLFNFPNR